MCVEPNLNDFYVIHHEMGHIQYYMSYADKIPLFQVILNLSSHVIRF